MPVEGEGPDFWRAFEVGDGKKGLFYSIMRFDSDSSMVLARPEFLGMLMTIPARLRDAS
jgi:hypothetical protein